MIFDIAQLIVFLATVAAYGYYLLMPSEKRILRMATDLAGKIHTVRQKRAACRVWVHPMRRRCSNCKHELMQYKFCAACVHEGWPVYWEPRKEGE